MILFKNKLQKAKASIKGSSKYPNIKGEVTFKQVNAGVMVTADLHGLPHSGKKCENGVFALHIHSGKSCSGNAADEFADALTHYNPNGCEHPRHAGDLPPLFENGGRAYMRVLTDRFKISDIIGLTVIVHADPDDMRAQPSGASGEKIACGAIVPV